jgi:hypothetical protein
VYTGLLATALAGEELCVHKLCQQTMGVPLPPTNSCGRIPTDAIYATAGLVCSAMALLPDRMGVGNHKVFIMDIKSDTILGDVFPWVFSAASLLLNCTSNCIKRIILGYSTSSPTDTISLRNSSLLIKIALISLKLSCK